MYSTNLKDNRYLARCIRAARNVKAVDFIVDTGAKYSCCNYKLLDNDMREEDVLGCEVKLIGGFIKGEFVKFYKYRLRQFTIGNLNLNEQDIWITFNEKVTDTVLGMDILKQVILISNPYNQKLYFCRDVDDFNINFKLIL